MQSIYQFMPNKEFSPQKVKYTLGRLGAAALASLSLAVGRDAHAQGPDADNSQEQPVPVLAMAPEADSLPEQVTVTVFDISTMSERQATVSIDPEGLMEVNGESIPLGVLEDGVVPGADRLSDYIQLTRRYNNSSGNFTNIRAGAVSGIIESAFLDEAGYCDVNIVYPSADGDWLSTTLSGFGTKKLDTLLPDGRLKTPDGATIPDVDMTTCMDLLIPGQQVIFIFIDYDPDAGPDAQNTMVNSTIRISGGLKPREVLIGQGEQPRVVFFEGILTQ